MLVENPLEDKLREIFYAWSGYRPGESKPVDREIKKDIAQIKQAFKDEGWIKLDRNVYLGKSVEELTELLHKGTIIEIYGDKIMLGKSFYDRFERQYHTSADWIAGDPDMGDEAEHDVLEAAKRAAGL